MKEYTQEYAENMYFTPDETDMSLGLWLVRLGRNKTKPSYNAGPRATDHFSLHFVQQGSVLFQYENNIVQLHKGDVFCLFPQRIYSYRPADPAVPLEMAWVAFDGDQAAALLSMIGIHPGQPYAKGVGTTEVALTLQHFWSAGALRPGRTRLRFLSLLYELIDLLDQRPEADGSPKHRQKDWVKKSLDYMNTHYSEPIDVNHIAQHAGIHRTYFSKVFTQHLGISPLKYLMRLRMNKAMQLLRETGLTVTEIALSLSYSDTATFSRAFSLYFGASPSYCRKHSSALPQQELEQDPPAR
ncbi:HTH-type transcriptional activator Btr [Paenibacillus konkukensis]|uniref:HTH-type transcriptional activator Btr n=1 Tax=Paenibacillus konkukensis TaxID=2020716 RepID=A0ABY4RW88_9BACL|nr:AraC family transcriptional regulator [Paenibacillus konkukensis]UQZ86919.1 HTH-type transcriptional activator Btr [Paenibacillus konkukensis]